MHGLLLIDKPAGMTSHDVVRRVRRLFKTRKVGHAGTLDPLATGVLPVAIGEGTKLLQFLLAEGKSYTATLRLGVTTDTLDAEGTPLTNREVPIDLANKLKDILPRFIGAIEQIPPMYSALKKNGVPLYKLARAGKVVERQARKVHIDRLEVTRISSPDVDIDVACSKGTYIRSLCADLGEALGCGAHITALRREQTGHFHIDRCIPLGELSSPADAVAAGAFLKIDDAVSYYPSAELEGQAAARLHNGVPPARSEVAISNDLQPGETVRLITNGHLKAMARYAPDREKEARGDFELIRVFNCTDNA